MAKGKEVDDEQLRNQDRTLGNTVRYEVNRVSGVPEIQVVGDFEQGCIGTVERAETRLELFVQIIVSEDGHSHNFTVKFSRTDRKDYHTDCDQPRTVLEAIKSTEHYKKKMKKCLDENIVIQLGEEDRESIVATHFPSSCIRDGEILIISCKSKKVEKTQDELYKTMHSRDNYSVFYIDTVGGQNTKSKELFRNKAVKQFKYLCVYGEKGMTVEEALKRDGRFIDDLGDFTLSDNDKPDSITEHTRKVDKLDNKRFKLCLERNKRANDGNTRPVLDVAHQRGFGVIAAVKESGSSGIYEMLCKQFPDLKEWMESRFPGDSFKEELNLRKENFGKIHQSFSEVHRVRKLLKLGESVCKVVVQDVCVGTGFVLFDNFILTNAHLFKDYVEGRKLREGIEVFALFNYEDPEPQTNYNSFQVKTLINYSQGVLDYAILELNPESQNPNQTTQTKKTKVPPALLKKFGPLPPNGEACMIGHPAGGVKVIDLMCIIKKEKGEQAVNDLFIVQSVRDKDQGIEDIMMGGNRADKVVNHNTFMYHGSSGSPLFDAHGRVFGLHTAEYVCWFQNHKRDVIEFANPLLTIFEHFVSEVKRNNDQELLKSVKKQATGNQYLKKVLNPEENDTDESVQT
ncbi:serine protease FAM111A-like [Symphorus nematophorus]